MRLGYESKGSLQAAYFGKLFEAYFKGGNASGNNANISYQIEQLVEGLAQAWDKADEHTYEN
jgi:hypothetical protein